VSATSATAPPTAGPQRSPQPRQPTWLPFAIAAVAVVGLALLAGDAGMHKAGLDGFLRASWGTLRATAAAVVLFGVCGYGVVRMWLPDGLRRHEPLWILPVGACVSSLSLTVLGYAYVPFWLSLPLVLAAAAGLAAYAHRRRGWTPRPGASAGWPAFAALMVACVALVPMFVAGAPTVIGPGSDAHMAAGTGEYLRHSHPTGFDASGPVDRVPLLWRSKPPIYYALGAVATLSGLETWQALAPLAALMLALASVGFFLVARELLGAGLAAGVGALAVVGLDRMVLHTVMTPYFNQTWGFATLPFALALSWWAVRHRSVAAAGLLALFLALGAFAYPLALPIPLAALGVFALADLLRRRREGRPLGLPHVPGGRRALIVAVPLALALAIPAWGVLEKARRAAEVVLNPNASLAGWGGDVFDFFPTQHFLAIPFETAWWVAAAGILGLAVFALARVERALAAGMAVTIGAFLLAAFSFRQRDFGYYLEFKTLAFVAPLLLACAAAGAGRLGRVGLGLLAALVLAAAVSGRQEVVNTGHHLRAEVTELREWDDSLPPDASVRLDMFPPDQLWAGYMLSGQPLCSQTPLLNTAYPRVPLSRRADYVLVSRFQEYRQGGKPVDALGAPVRENQIFRLYRARPGIPGPDRCSRRMEENEFAL
jgi:hypothetical protein